MSRITFFTFDGGGNQPPTIGIAAEAQRRGHTTAVVGYEIQRHRFEALGLPFSVFPGSGSFVTPIGDPMESLMATMRAVLCNREHLLEVPELASGSDAVVIDNLLFSALAAAERNEIPTVVLVHTAAAFFGPTSVPPAMVAALNEIRAIDGLTPVETPLDLTAFARAVLVNVFPDLDEYSGRADQRWHYLGPVLPPVPGQPESLPWQAPAPDLRPLVVVSLTTGRAWGPQRHRLQRILDALAGLLVRVLLTTGGTVAPDELVAPANAVVRDFVPHRHVMAGAAACVSHGGHGTLAEALAQSVALVLMPDPMSDQVYLADRIQERGAGLVIGHNAPEEQIREAVAAVLDDPDYRMAAGRLSKMVDPDAAGRAVSVIERVAAGSAAATA